MSTTSRQILPIPNNYLTGLSLSLVTPKTLLLSKGQARDSTDNFDIVIPNDITIDITKNDVNGFFPGNPAGNLFYSVYVIASSLGNRTPAAVMTALGTQPSVLPTGYDLFRQVGIWKTDGAVNLVIYYQTGSEFVRNYFIDQPTGTASLDQTTFTVTSLQNFVPALPGVTLLMDAVYTSPTVGNEFVLRPAGSTSTDFLVRKCIIATSLQSFGVEMPCLLAAGIPSIEYKVGTGDELTLYPYRFTIQLT